ncbi:DUF2127 domain-containing protein [Streptomyces sp. NPDC052109]|uniref:DUF2127 domain-containing protein n=1 Tax=Streptomyces sp. NPDC052109 TaxID=3155527 RepID=UPI00343F889A
MWAARTPMTAGRYDGTNAARVRPEDGVLVRDFGDGPRLHRCRRCDAWLLVRRADHRDRDCVAGPTGRSGRGPLGDLDKAFAARSSSLRAVGLVLGTYAVLEGIEAIGLWLVKRWAENLTCAATTVLLVPENGEPAEALTAAINVAISAIFELSEVERDRLEGGAPFNHSQRDVDPRSQAARRRRAGRDVLAALRREAGLALVTCPASRSSSTSRMRSYERISCKPKCMPPAPTAGAL